MVVLRTLGECVIEAGTHRIGPSAPHLFAILLYLGIERGRRVPRQTLQELLFPGARESNGAHSLRQLLHRLRKLGVPVESGIEGVSLPAEQVTDDYAALFVPAADIRADVQRAAGGFLPAYAPRFSDDFRAWVDEQRSYVHGRIRRTLLAELDAHRRACRWEAAERTARSCLAIDALNEEATFGLAEALAAAGSKVQAVRLLDRYIAEAGPGAEAVRLPATLLRRRIAERLPAVEYDATRATFVGRAEEMAELHGLLRRARGGESCTAVVWGEAGIGKTRLVAEFCKAAVLAGATVLRAVSQPHDVRRPMGAFLDLTPQLLRLPGALGTSPEAMKYLQRLVTFDPHVDQPLTPEMRDPEYLAACITRALSELLDAVTAEAPLILVVEDAHWLDRVSTLVLADLLAERRERRLLLVSTWRATEDPTPDNPFPERTRSLRLLGLPEDDAQRLLRDQLRELAVPPSGDVMEWGVRTGQGNPFFLHELARHYAVHREIGAVPTSLLDLLRARLDAVGADAQRVLAACATLGALATLPRLEAMLQMPRPAFQEAIAKLERWGLLDCSEIAAGITHPLLAELVLQRTPPGAKRLLCQYAAEVLGEEDFEQSPSIALASAEMWIEAGRGDRAEATLARCLAFAAQLGQCRQALELIQRVRLLNPAHSASAALLLAEIDVCSLLYDDAQMLKAFSLLPPRAMSQLPPMRREELKVQRLFALWRSGSDPIELAHQADELLLSFSDARSRTALALLRLILSELLIDLPGAHRTYQLIAHDLESLSTEQRSATNIDLVYFTIVGRRSEALHSARRELDRLQSAGPLASNVGPALRTASALARAMECDLALSVYDQLYAATAALSLHNSAFSAATQCTASLLTWGRLEEARAWHTRATQHYPNAAVSVHMQTYYVCDAILGAADGDDLRAHTALSSLRPLLPTDAASQLGNCASQLEALLRRRGQLAELPYLFVDAASIEQFAECDAELHEAFSRLFGGRPYTLAGS